MENEIVQLKSLMASVVIMFSFALGAVRGTKAQIKRIQKANAEGVPHNEGVEEEFLVEMVGVYWKLAKLLIGVLALLVVMDRLYS